jgi:hypothetical protein
MFDGGNYQVLDVMGSGPASRRHMPHRLAIAAAGANAVRTFSTLFQAFSKPSEHPLVLRSSTAAPRRGVAPSGVRRLAAAVPGVPPLYGRHAWD